MIKIISIISFISFFLNFSLNAQQTSREDQFISNINSQQLIGEEYIDAGYINKGLYFRDVFLPGYVVVNSKDTIHNLKLRYNYATDQLIWLSENFGQVQLNKNSILGFEIKNADTIFRFSQLCIQPEISPKKNFFQICYQGKVQLLIQRRSLISTNYIKNGHKYTLYKPESSYFLIVGDKTYSMTKLNIKEIYRLFPSKKEIINDHLKNSSHRIKTDNEFIHFLIMTEGLLLD